MHARYRITYCIPVKASWLGWEYPLYYETATTKGDLDILVTCIKEDASIDRAFYEDVANGKITHFKADFKALP